MQVVQHAQLLQFTHDRTHGGGGNSQAVAVRDRLRSDCLTGGKVLGHHGVQNLLCTCTNVAHGLYLTRKSSSGQERTGPQCSFLRPLASTARRALRLALVVTSDYLQVMKVVRVAELKSHLSEHLRSVRRGHPLMVLDRDTPIAQIVPCPHAAAGPLTRQPMLGSRKPKDFRPLTPLKLRYDPVAVLLEDRHLR
jgi:antitoxin (DNA-binding transcriptional repressor) of toxin-antitoxin stability system